MEKAIHREVWERFGRGSDRIAEIFHIVSLKHRADKPVSTLRGKDFRNRGRLLTGRHDPEIRVRSTEDHFSKPLRDPLAAHVVVNLFDHHHAVAELIEQVHGGVEILNFVGVFDIKLNGDPKPLRFRLGQCDQDAGQVVHALNSKIAVRIRVLAHQVDNDQTGKTTLERLTKRSFPEIALGADKNQVRLL